MKLYDFTGAPNPKKVRVYLAEKGISVPLEPVDRVALDNAAERRFEGEEV